MPPTDEKESDINVSNADIQRLISGIARSATASGGGILDSIKLSKLRSVVIDKISGALENISVGVESEAIKLKSPEKILSIILPKSGSSILDQYDIINQAKIISIRSKVYDALKDKSEELANSLARASLFESETSSQSKNKRLLELIIPAAGTSTLDKYDFINQMKLISIRSKVYDSLFSKAEDIATAMAEMPSKNQFTNNILRYILPIPVSTEEDTEADLLNLSSLRERIYSKIVENAETIIVGVEENLKNKDVIVKDVLQYILPKGTDTENNIDVREFLRDRIVSKMKEAADLLTPENIKDKILSSLLPGISDTPPASEAYSRDTDIELPSKVQQVDVNIIDIKDSPIKALSTAIGEEIKSNLERFGTNLKVEASEFKTKILLSLQEVNDNLTAINQSILSTSRDEESPDFPVFDDEGNKKGKGNSGRGKGRTGRGGTARRGSRPRGGATPKPSGTTSPPSSGTPTTPSESAATSETARPTRPSMRPVRPRGGATPKPSGTTSPPSSGTPTTPSAPGTGLKAPIPERALKAGRVIGKAAIPIAIAAETYGAYRDYKEAEKIEDPEEKKKAQNKAIGGGIGSIGGGILGSIAAGALAGSVVPGPGTIGGAIVGLGVGLGVGYLGSKVGRAVGEEVASSSTPKLSAREEQSSPNTKGVRVETSNKPVSEPVPAASVSPPPAPPSPPAIVIPPDPAKTTLNSVEDANSKTQTLLLKDIREILAKIAEEDGETSSSFSYSPEAETFSMSSEPEQDSSKSETFSTSEAIASNRISFYESHSKRASLLS